MKNSKTIKKKYYGYATCGLIAFAAVTSYPAKTTHSENQIKPSMTFSESHENIDFRQSRTYIIDNKPRLIDTSQPGWAVKILLEE